MKILFISTIVLLNLAFESCRKSNPIDGGVSPGNERKIRFQLYTNKDFSSETSVIAFSVFIRNTRTSLFDSSLAPMQLKDIPDAAHKIIIEKTLSVNGSTDLAAGFHYEIQNVGHSGYIDTSKGGNAFKVIDYAFQ